MMHGQKNSSNLSLSQWFVISMRCSLCIEWYHII